MIFSGVKLKSDHILDVRGRPCPIPLIMTKKKIKKIKKGEIIEIISDEWVSKENLERFGKKKFNLLHIDEDNDIFKVYIRK